MQKPLLLVPMTFSQIHIPDELEPVLQQVPDDIEGFIVDAVRKQLSLPSQAEDADIEASAAVDVGDASISADEVQYYLNLPDIR